MMLRISIQSIPSWSKASLLLDIYTVFLIKDTLECKIWSLHFLGLCQVRECEGRYLRKGRDPILLHVEIWPPWATVLLYFPLPPALADEECGGDDEEGGGGGHGDHQQQRQVEVAAGREEHATHIVLEEGEDFSQCGSVSQSIEIFSHYREVWRRWLTPDENLS